jgi:hypothetical protein
MVARIHESRGRASETALIRKSEERVELKHLAGVLIPGVCDEYSSFGASHLARGQSDDRCGALFQTIWCPAMA